MRAAFAPALVACLLAACAHVDGERLVSPRFDDAVAGSEARPDDDVGAGPRPGFVARPGDVTRDEAGALLLSLEQATMIALERNRDLAVRRLAPVVAGTFDKIERGAFDPEVFAELRLLDERTSEFSGSTGDRNAVNATEREAVAGVRRRLPSGTSFEASIEQDRRSSDDARSEETTRLGLTVTQSLLRGNGPAVNLARVRQAELGEEASLYELRGFTEALVADVRVAYWQFVLAQREIAIFEESLAVARRQLDEVAQRIAVGVLPRAESPSAEVEVARREQALIEARSVLEERRLRLLRLLDPDGSGALDARIVATGELETGTEPITDLPDRLELALMSRPDLREAHLRLEQRRLETVVTRDGIRPRLDLFASLHRTGFDDSFAGSLGELPGPDGDVTVGLSLSYFLGNRTARWQDVAARTERRRATLAIENLEQQIRMDVLLAANEVGRAREQIAASRHTRELQARQLEAEQERFDVGDSTGLLVAQAQRDLLAARIGEVEATVSYRIALLRLALAEGSLLDRSGIRIEPAY